MKKRIMTIAAGIMAFAMLTACGKSEVRTAEVTAAVSAEGDSDEIDMDAELEAVQDSLSYMGGLYIRDPENDLMFALFKNEGGDIVAVVTKLGERYYGIPEDMPSKTLEDGRGYTSFTIEGHTFGYYFGDASFVVDEDGTVYDGIDIDESVARDMVGDTFKAGGR